MPSTLSFTAPRMDLQQAADEYNSLSKEEKDLAWRDLYGKEKLNPDEETEEMISSRLSEMYDALQVIPERSKISYNRALQLCPDYVSDRDFLLMFLRADCFDAKKAALRLVKYWNAKEDAFGSHRAFRKITLADMDEADFDTLRSGGYMPLPNRDKAGRALMFATRTKFVYSDRKQIIRLLFYVLHYSLEDITVQQKGIVGIVFEDGPFDVSKYDRKLDRVLMDYTNHVWPHRFVGLHHCFDSVIMDLLLPFLLYMMGPAVRARYRIHPGKYKDERLSHFADFGIGADCLPTLMGGNVEWDCDTWLEERRRQGK